MAAESHSVLVEDVRDETPSIRTLRLKLPQDRDGAFSFMPGQSVTLAFTDDPATQRTYSIASSPLDRGFIEISVNRLGRFTARLFDLRPGAELLAQGPHGKWFYTDDVSHGVLISGGTGLTPFRSIVRYVLQKGLQNRVSVLHSSRVPSEIPYRAELEQWSKHPNLRVMLTVTRAEAMRAGETWTGAKGRIDVEKIRSLVPDLRGSDYYLCGPGPLVTNLAQALTAEGVGAQRLHYETWR